MDDKRQEEQPAHAVPMSTRDLMSVFIIGAIVGLIAWGLGILLSRYVLDALLCQNGSVGQCSNLPNYSAAASLLIGSVLGLVGLIRFRVYRPLLVVLASAISLWGLVQVAWGLQWYWGVLISVVMFLLAYGLFSWIARLRVFWLALVATVVIVVAVRLAMMS